MDAPMPAGAPDEAPPTIKLDQFLKFAGLAATGGQAKWLVQMGHVQVNGEVETRRGRKLHVGDTVTVEGRTLRVELQPPSARQRFRD